MLLPKVFYQNGSINSTHSCSPTCSLSSEHIQNAVTQSLLVRLQSEQPNNEYNVVIMDSLMCQSILGLCYDMTTAEAIESSLDVVLDIKTASCLRQGLDTLIRSSSKTASKLSIYQALNRNEPTYESNEDEGEQEDICRGVFPLRNSVKTIFSEDIEIKTKELPSWKPNIVVNAYHFEDDDE